MEELVYYNLLKSIQDLMILLILKIQQDKHSLQDFQMHSLLETEKLLPSPFLKDKELSSLQFKREILDLVEKRKLQKKVKVMIETI